MEQLASKPTITVYLSGHEPISTSYTINYVNTIEGVTNVILNLSNIDTSIYNLYKIIVYKDDEKILTLNPTVLPTGNTVLPIQTIDCLFIPKTTTGVVRLDAHYRNGNITTYNVILYTVLDNILDMDLTIINTQMTYSSGRYIPIINFESNSNTVYPATYFEALSNTQTQFTTIYLKTNPEINASLSAASFPSLSSSNIINTESSNRILAI